MNQIDEINQLQLDLIQLQKDVEVLDSLKDSEEDKLIIRSCRRSVDLALSEFHLDERDRDIDYAFGVRELFKEIIKELLADVTIH